jgi:hypothetical protein
MFGEKNRGRSKRTFKEKTFNTLGSNYTRKQNPEQVHNPAEDFIKPKDTVANPSLWATFYPIITTVLQDEAGLLCPLHR